MLKMVNGESKIHGASLDNWYYLGVKDDDLMTGPVTRDSAQFGQWLRDKRPDVAMERYLLRRELTFVRRVLGGTIQPRRLLEVCCGDGWITIPLHATGFPAVGLDINLVPLGILRRQFSGLPLVLGDAMCLPFADGSLDCVVAIQCLHFLDRTRFLQECSRIMRSGGLLILESLNRHSYKWLQRRLRRCFSRSPSGAVSDKWVDILSCGEILREIAGHGFTTEAVSGYGWIPFARHSNSSWVGVMARVEQALRLERWYSISPRIIVAARKSL
jgi:SAM-dependent methyltransferase